MKRIILHWTAGTHTVSNLDRQHYHFVISGDGMAVAGTRNPEANLNCRDGDYAAHTRGTNTGSIGVSLAGMHGAKEHPFSHGSYPLTKKQLDACAVLCADLCETYKIPVSRETVLSHAEVEPTLGISQRGKWDINWLPGMSKTGDPIEVGDKIRDMIRREMRPAVRVPVNPFAAVAAFLAKLFSR